MNDVAMPIICPYDGHTIESPRGHFCTDHGVKWFVQCPVCGVGWTTKPAARYARTAIYHGGWGETGSDFCANCGMPGSWLSRERLIVWLRTQIQADASMPAATRLELLAVMDRLQEMDSNDTKAIAGWEQVKTLAPKVWEASKPVRDALIGEAVKKALGL